MKDKLVSYFNIGIFAYFNLVAGIFFITLACYTRFIHGVGTLHDLLINSGVTTPDGRNNLVHILSAIGCSGVLYIFIRFFTSLKGCPRIKSNFNNCIGAGSFYIAGEVLWEFFNTLNTANQFLYDLIGVAIYLLATCLILKIWQKNDAAI